MTPQHQPRLSQKQRIKAIGKVLVTRRITMDPARHSRRPGWMETVKEHSDLSESVITNIETGVRSNYRDATLNTLEKLYDLQPGTLAKALHGGDLIAADGKVLYPPPPPEKELDPDRFVAEQRRDKITGSVISLVRDLDEKTRDMSQEEADATVQRALDAARLWAEAERRGRGEAATSGGDS